LFTSICYYAINSEKTGHVSPVISRLRGQGLMNKPPEIFEVQDMFFLGHRVPTLGAARLPPISLPHNT
jgi:hypothetical protein